MRKLLFCLALALAAMFPLQSSAVLSDNVVVTDDIYGPFSGSIVEGAEGEIEPILTWRSAVFARSFHIYLTEPGTGLISDVLWSDGNDILFFASDGSQVAGIGLACGVFTTDPRQCLEETGLLQDVTALIGELTGTTADVGFAICCGAGSTVSVQSDVPEPGSLALLGLALAGLGYRRRRHAR